MSNRSGRTFKILIYESEYRQIQAWTNKFENLETGGDLFGLWHDERTAVVQLVLGPGKRCRRTSTSFYQDVEYLRRMGDTLTSEEGLCHIGEWHSHHRLSLTSPSGGDETTIWSNMDRYGLSRFVLCIANICTSWSWSDFSYLPDETTVNGFLFEVAQQRQYHRCLPVLHGEFIFLQEESPFRSKYLNVIQEGAESLNTVEDYLRVVLEKYKKMESVWKKVRQKLETSLEEERKARKETNIRLANSQHQAADLQSSLTAERKAKRETEKTLNSVVEKTHQLQSSLDAQTQARDAAERQLYNREQRLNELETSLKRSQQTRAELKEALAAEQKAHEETRTNLSSNEQESRLRELEISLAAERQERQKAEQRNYSSEQQAHHLQSFLDEQTQAREDAERRLYISEQRVHVLETSLERSRQAIAREIDLKAHEETRRDLEGNSEQRLRSHELEISLAVERQERKKLEASLAEGKKAHEETKRALWNSEQESRQLQASLAEEKEAHEETSRDTTREWLLDGNELTLSDTILREGEWGRVVEGRFHGCKVAVKVVQRNNLQLPIDRSFFDREMIMAFECRHSRLLQFIGVTFDDQSLFFVSELPDTSLKAVLHDRPLEPAEIMTIALDVAEGLSYLHFKHIVHGDINSATVVLFRNDGAGWQAKISDYCTVKFLQQSMKNFPYNSIYAAPEAQTSWSPKADVYSFGVLLWEMNLGKVPDRNENLDQQRARLPGHYRRLIRRCVMEDPEKRLSMEEIIDKISKIPLNA